MPKRQYSEKSPNNKRFKTTSTPESRQLSLLSLPDEILVLVLSLMELKDLAALSLTNKHLNALANDHMLWKNLVAQFFPFLIQETGSPLETDYKALFYQHGPKYKKLMTNPLETIYIYLNYQSLPNIYHYMQGRTDLLWTISTSSLPKIKQHLSAREQFSQNQLLGFALAFGRKDVLELVKSHKDKRKVQYISFQVAAYFGDIPYLQELSTASPYGLAPLAWEFAFINATENNQLDVLKWLYSLGIKSSNQNRIISNCLETALRKNAIELAQWLLEKENNIADAHFNSTFEQILLTTVKSCGSSIAKILQARYQKYLAVTPECIRLYPASVLNRDLFINACMNRDPEVLKILFTDKKERLRQTFFEAYKNNDFVLMDKLKNHIPETINAEELGGLLGKAIQDGKLEWVEYFCKFIGSIKIDLGLALFTATSFHKTHIVKWLLNEFGHQISTLEKHTALNIAILIPIREAIQASLDNNVRPNSELLTLFASHRMQMAQTWSVQQPHSNAFQLGSGKKPRKNG